MRASFITSACDIILPLVWRDARYSVLRGLHVSGRRYDETKKTTNHGKHGKFREQFVEIQTCGELYEKWRREKRFWKIPKGNLHFKISYVDTFFMADYHSTDEENRQGGPVALTLHGAPGSFKDFTDLISHLHDNGARVIAPKLPDFTDYQPGIFRHSAEEKAQLIKDFLKELNINQIDMLICHSSSIYPGLLLCLKNSFPTVRSLVMLNPAAYSIMRATKPYRPMRAIVRISEFPAGLKFLQVFGVFLMKLINVPVRLNDVMDPLLSATTMCFADFPQAKDNLKEVSSRKLPILFAFGEDDKLIDKPLSYDMAYLLGARDSDIFYYDQSGKLIHTGVEKPFLKVMAFKEGSHYVFWKHPDIINESVVSFMKKVMEKKS